MEHVERQHLAASARRLVRWVFVSVVCVDLLLFGTMYLALRDPGVIVPMILLPCVFAAIYALMLASSQSVRIDAQGVHVRDRFFHRRERSFAWADIANVQLRPLRIFGEFGGWGIRYGIHRTWGYVYDGEVALDLSMQDGRRIVISITDQGGVERTLHALDVAFTSRSHKH